jgi:putative ABC transport system permease protein
MQFFKIALLNLRKHLKRSLLILGIVAFSVVIMIFVSGLFEGMRVAFFQNMFSSSGHVQIEAAGRSDALDPMSLQYVLDDPKTILTLLNDDPRIAAIESMVAFGGLLLREGKNVTMQGWGVDPETVYFSDVREDIVEGAFLASDGEILVSRSTAKLLSLEVGGPAVVLTEDSTGSAFYMEYTVSGLYETGDPELDDATFFITRPAAQELLYIDDGVTQIRINLTDRAYTEAFAADYRQPVQENGGAVRTYRDIFGSFVVMMEFMDVFTIGINLLLVIVAATVITNAILMNVFAKTAEYGTMRAIGMKKKQHFRLILAEGTVLGIAGALLGTAVGIPFTLYFQYNGIYFGPAGNAIGIGSSLYAAVRPGDVFLSLLAGLLVAVGGSLYAASVNVRMPIIKLVRGA